MDNFDDLSKHSSQALSRIEQKSETEVSIIKKQIEKRREQGMYDRQERWSNGVNSVKIWLMRFISLMTVVFIVLIFIAGLVDIRYEADGWVALAGLFGDLIENANTIIFIVIGFFFRGYTESIKEAVKG